MTKRPGAKPKPWGKTVAVQVPSVLVEKIREFIKKWKETYPKPETAPKDRTNFDGGTSTENDQAI